MGGESRRLTPVVRAHRGSHHDLKRLPAGVADLARSALEPCRERVGARPVRLGYFWIRLIFTIGWAIYPILHFVDVVIGSGQASGVVALYTLFDLINLITPSLIVLAVASQERY